MAHPERRLRITFLTHYFPPEVGAPQARMHQLAQRLQDGGDEVTVLTALPNHPTAGIHPGMLGNRTAIWLAERLERHLYRRAARVTVPTPGMLERLVARGIPREKLFLLTNGVDTDLYQPQPPDPALAQRLGLDGHKVF